MKSRGFTLIELLIVISIVGSLASTVLVSMSGARDKARIAASSMFADNLYQAWGADAVGVWDVGSVDGAPIQDVGPNGITLTKNSNSSVLGKRSTNTPNSSGYSLDFTSGYLPFTPSYENSSINLDLSKYSGSVWIYKSNNGLGGQSVLGIQGASSNLILHVFVDINLSKVFASPFLMCGSNPEPGFSYKVPTDKWVNLAFSWDGTTSRLYVDGKFVASSVSGCTPFSADFIAKKISIGGIQGSPHFTGFINDFAIYNEVLTADRIQQIYAEGAPKHMLAQTK